MIVLTVCVTFLGLVLSLFSGCGGSALLTPEEKKGVDLLIKGVGKETVIANYMFQVAENPEKYEKSDVLRYLEYFVSKGANVNAKFDVQTYNKGATPLHFAARYGDFEIVKFLVSKGADVNETDNFGNTPLDVAHKAEKGVVLDYLLSQGAQPGKTNRQE